MILNSISQKISIRWRLTLLFVAVFGSTFVGFAIVTFNFLAGTLQKEFDDALYNYAVDVHESISLDPHGDFSVPTPALDRGKLYPFALGTPLIQIRRVKGDIVTSVGNFGKLTFPLRRELDRLANGEEADYHTIRQLEGLPDKEAEEYRLITLPIDNSPQPQLLLQVAVPMTLLENQISNRKIVLGFAIPILLIIAVSGGYFLSTRAFRPVTQMIATAKAIGVERLSDRVPIPPTRDELRRLAEALNEMLERIERAFASQERFIADASHQLLTPLAIMQGELESSLRSPTPPGVDVLQSNLQEVEHLSQIVQQLLLLARVEAGRAALSLTPLSFADVVMESVARVTASAKKKNIRVQVNMRPEMKTQNSAEAPPEVESPPQAVGDFDLLQNLVFNLIENAIKYSPPGEIVKVDLIWTKSQQSLIVDDNGPGVPEDQMSLIFERFHRGDTTRPGHGLGLAIAKKISDAHGAKLSVVNKYMNSHNKNGIAGCRFCFEIKNI